MYIAQAEEGEGPRLPGSSWWVNRRSQPRDELLQRSPRSAKWLLVFQDAAEKMAPPLNVSWSLPSHPHHNLHLPPLCSHNLHLTSKAEFNFMGLVLGGHLGLPFQQTLNPIKEETHSIHLVILTLIMVLGT